MKGYNTGEVWLNYSTAKPVMFLRYVDNYVYYYDVYKNKVHCISSEGFLDNFAPKFLAKNGNKFRVLSLNIFLNEVLKMAIMLLCFSLLVLSNIALFEYLGGLK